MQSLMRFNLVAAFFLLATLSVTPPIQAQDPSQLTANGTPSDPNVPRKIGGNILPPVLLHSMTYIPRDGFDRIIERPGPITLEFVIDRKGHTTDIHLLRSCGRPAADWSAVKSLSEFRFKPATENGQPVAVRVQFEINVNVNIITPSDIGHTFFDDYNQKPIPPSVIQAVAPKQEPSWFGKQDEYTVNVEYMVPLDGKPTNLQVIGPPQEHFDDAALDAIRQCLFKPATLAGQPIVFPMHSLIHFRRTTR
jgi:TonB family protein